MSRLLIWLSGADPDVIARCSSGERIKFHGLGGAVLTTSVMAALSCGFALHMAMRLPLPLAMLLAVGWGCAIMNLDRWLISSTQRRDSVRGNVAMALPRLVLGLLIGLVISTPLVLRIFEDEINAQLQVMHQRAEDAFVRRTATDARFLRIPELTKRIADLQAAVDRGVDVSAVPQVAALREQLDKVDAEYRQAAKEVLCEEDGTCGTRVPGMGNSYRLKVAHRDQLAADRQALQAQLDAARRDAAGTGAAALAQTKTDLAAARADLSSLESAKAAVEAEFGASERNNSGLLARLSALAELTDRHRTLLAAHLMLLLFITAFEVMPVLFKLLMNLAPPTLYDKVRVTADDAYLDVAVGAYQRERLLAGQASTERAEAVAEYLHGLVELQRAVAQQALADWGRRQLPEATSERPAGTERIDQSVAAAEGTIAAGTTGAGTTGAGITGASPAGAVNGSRGRLGKARHARVDTPLLDLLDKDTAARPGRDGLS